MWGDVDLIWSIIFIIIVIAMVYWAVIVFTRTKVVPFEFLPTEPQDFIAGDDDEIDLLAKDEPFFEGLIFIL
jgi:hypothetical protein